MAERKANVRWQQTARKIQAVGAMKQNLSFAQVQRKNTEIFFELVSTLNVYNPIANKSP